MQAMPHQKNQRPAVNHTLLLMYALFVLFVGLKLTGDIAWSWWLVFAPLWGLVVAQFMVGLILGCVVMYRAVRRGAIGKANDERRG